MRKCIIICDLTALNAESAEQMALLHLTRLFPRRKEAGHVRLIAGEGLCHTQKSAYRAA